MYHTYSDVLRRILKINIYCLNLCKPGQSKLKAVKEAEEVTVIATVSYRFPRQEIMANSIDWFTLSNSTMIEISICSYVFCLGKIDNKVLKTGQEYKCKKKILTRINKVVKPPTTKLMIRSWKRQESVSQVTWIQLLPEWKPESYRIKRPKAGPLTSTKESCANKNVEKVFRLPASLSLGTRLTRCIKWQRRWLCLPENTWYC